MEEKLFFGTEQEVVVRLLRNMLLIRRFEEKIVELYPEQEMRCPTHLCIGQEAIAAGVCMNLDKEDIVFSNHRAHGHYIAKGGNINSMLAEIYGKETGCSSGRGGSMHLIDLDVNFYGSTPIVGGTIPLAAGTAFASKVRNKKNISVVFFGDAAIEEGVFHETLNFSSLHKLPILFICENNLYSSQTHIKDRQPPREISKLAAAHGILAFNGNGNDVISVYKITKKAIDCIKSGKGPVFINFLTYRWREHCGPNYDNSLGYRSEEEILKWKKKCPIKKLESMLLGKKILTNELINRIENEVKVKIDEAVAFSKKSPFPEAFEKFVFSE